MTDGCVILRKCKTSSDFRNDLLSPRGIEDPKVTKREGVVSMLSMMGLLKLLILTQPRSSQRVAPGVTEQTALAIMGLLCCQKD